MSVNIDTTTATVLGIRQKDQLNLRSIMAVLLQKKKHDTGINWRPLFLYLFMTVFGCIGGPFLMRLYFMHGGKRKWLSSWLQNVGFPFFLGPLLFLYFKQQTESTPASFFMDSKLFASSAGLGVIVGLDSYFYSVGLFYIPVSTSGILTSTQLSFTALFAFLIVKQKLTFYSINSVILMTLGAIVLAFHSSGDRPPGVSNSEYFLGFFFTLAGAVLLGLSFPLVELAYSKSSKPITLAVVLQFQFIASLSATIFCTIGMVINNDFDVIPREAKEYAIGEVKYYIVLVTSAIAWQFLFTGMLGVVYYTSSLFFGIFSSGLLPFVQIGAVIAFHDKFTSEKGLSLGLCLWSFVSYFIGEYRSAQKKLTIVQEEEEIV
ncbi:purine permease 3-like [Macadamia integrifolia]|uniref:purine permease 3-like n=1 Tax=Macadamia integrifolia TaxID=60698 RepID=UPI001C4FDF75|nr:purine permease 3-like [Macadamia integrifolia]XP_042503861.1 purine permease 3-like [Macadamia integrifolia]